MWMLRLLAFLVTTYVAVSTCDSHHAGTRVLFVLSGSSAVVTGFGTVIALHKSYPVVADALLMVALLCVSAASSLLFAVLF